MARRLLNMPRTHRTQAIRLTRHPAAEANLTSVSVEYGCEAQPEGPVRDAAYRVAKLATCHIDLVDGRWTCDLQATAEAVRRKMGPDDLRAIFVDAVNDENIRSRLWRDSESLRNVIVALAFGSLAREYAAAPRVAE